MIRRPPRTTRTYPLVPYTTLCRSLAQSQPNQGPNAARLSGELHRSLFGGAPRKQSLDLVGGPLNRELQRLVDMDIVLRHILRGMTQHRPDRKFRKSEVAGNASEGVAKSVRREDRKSTRLNSSH